VEALNERFLVAVAAAAVLAAACTGLSVCKTRSGDYAAHGDCGPDATVTVTYDTCGNAYVTGNAGAAGLPDLAGTITPNAVWLPDGGPAPLPDGGQVNDGGVTASIRVCDLEGNADAGWSATCQIYADCIPDAGCPSIAQCTATLSP